MRILPAMLLVAVLGASLSVADNVTSSRWIAVSSSQFSHIVACAQTSPVVAFASARPEGRVSIRKDRGSVVKEQTSFGPLLPFDPGPSFAVEGSWITLALDDGWFVGRDSGEWGGGLWWFPHNKPPQQVIAGNVWAAGRDARGVYVISDGSYASGGSDVGILWTLGRDERGAWSVDRKFTFEGHLLAIHDGGTGDAYILSSAQLLHWTGRELTVMLDDLERVAHLAPFSVALDAKYIYVGMKLLFFRLDRHGGRVSWFMPAECRQLEYRSSVESKTGTSATVKRCLCVG